MIAAVTAERLYDMYIAWLVVRSSGLKIEHIWVTLYIGIVTAKVAATQCRLDFVLSFRSMMTRITIMITLSKVNVNPAPLMKNN
ncbi:hypothetical protein O9G_006399 [Rozella allomycis CSF55]|uniref:Uncharacterized protein n=1 Tax=Rozella allomycis (strain CSF55) TaxID=988480 RepID=A0A075AQE9_ROZAC|nr:hypothetical protein O9G_006399 [Rozella allomycis CSF55]|eukprot:EPZ30940.1 hypothetical protein O9G_006399 [Rozella allomycis CSF55]